MDCRGLTAKLLTTEFEDGGKRKPFKGRLIEKPVSGNAARPSWSDPIAKALTFAQMKLHPVKTPAGGVRYIGRQNTYTVKGVGVFQRTDKQDSKLIWAFAAKQKIPKKLGW